MITRLRKSIDAFVWGDSLRQYGLPGRIATGALRNLYAVLRDLLSGQLSLRAMSLVYSTLLSIVPLLAVSFSALKAFNLRNEIEPHIYGFLEPLGEAGVELTDTVMELVNNVNGGVLGGIGLAFFLYTAISMVQKIEESFNFVWYVSKPRSVAKRLFEYLAVLIVGALAAAIAISTLTTIGQEDIVVSIQENEVLKPVFSTTDALKPYAIIISIFTFLYMYMPNTNVKFRSALVGGVAGGVLWATTSLLFATFLASSGNRQAIYASFAVAIGTLIWLYLNWLILLIGSQIAFYYQNPAYLRIGRREPRLSNAMRERLALDIMYVVGKEFRNPVIGINLRSIGRMLRIPTITLAPIVAGLESKGLLTSNEKECFLPGREMSRISLAEIVSTVREDGETGSHRDPKWDLAIDNIGSQLDSAVAATLGDRSLRQLLDENEG